MERIYNRSFTFILPMLDHRSSDFLINDNLKGCFIGDTDYPELDNHIFILYAFSNNKWFLNYEEELKNCDYYVTSYEPDKYHTMYVYDVPVHQQINYDCIKEGKYSKVSDEYKKRMIDFHTYSTNRESAERIRAVVYKHDSAYRTWENIINDGLPKSRWTFIPRDQDPAPLMDMNIEIYSGKFKQGSVLEDHGRK